MPIQNGATFTLTCGPSSSKWNGSLAGLPIVKVPPGTGTMSKLTEVPGIVSVYGATAVGGRLPWLAAPDRASGAAAITTATTPATAAPAARTLNVHHRKVYPVPPPGLSGGAAGPEGPRRLQNN